MAAGKCTRWRSAGLVVVALWVAVALGFSAATTGASAGFTAAVRNPTNPASTAPYFSCTDAANSAGAANTFFVYPLGEGAGRTAADVSTNARPGTYTTSGVSYRQPGPCPRNGARAITLDGAAGYVSGPTATQTNPSSFTVEIWFRTTTTRGGKLIGFGNVRTGQSGRYDRHLYVASNGQLYFGVYPGAVRTIAGPRAYNDGRWHHAVATLSPTAGTALYVDGAVVAGDPNTTSAENYTGFWRIGYDNVTGWTNQPASFYFAGSIAYPAVYSVPLTAAQVRARYLAGS